MSEHKASHSRGPWQVTMRRVDGHTVYTITQHTHTSICVEPDGYWPEGYEPDTDKDGYPQPDDHMDCVPERVCNAHLIAAAPNLLAACEEAYALLTGTLGHHPDNPVPTLLREEIAKAKGPKP